MTLMKSKFAFLLAGENIDLAKEEVLALLNAKKYELHDRLLIIETKKVKLKELSQRLAFTHSIYQLLFAANKNKNNLKKAMQSFKWQSIYKGGFSFRIRNMNSDRLKFSEQELSSIIWSKLKTPKVNLNAAETKIELLSLKTAKTAKNSLFCLMKLFDIKKDFDKRKAHLRPGFNPVSLDPRLARCIVNLTGAKKGSKILDPFCGTGGILIEAGLMGLKPIGCDIDEEMLRKTQLNLEHFGIKHYELKKMDAAKSNKKVKFDYVVTDLPYGRSSKADKNLEQLYLNFLKNLEKRLKKRAVVVFPDFLNRTKLIKKAKLKAKREFSCYIHKTLTKKIVMVSTTE